MPWRIHDSISRSSTGANPEAAASTARVSVLAYPSSGDNLVHPKPSPPGEHLFVFLFFVVDLAHKDSHRYTLFLLRSISPCEVMVVVPIMSPSAATSSNIGVAANVQPWTEQVAETPQSSKLSTKSPRATSVRLSIPLDPTATVATPKAALHDNVRPRTPTQGHVHTSNGKRTLVRRDSLERREALLKGKEGSRQRRRWENGKFTAARWSERRHRVS